MFLTHHATPAELLSQIITIGKNREATRAFKNFRHNKDLCPAFTDRIRAILSSFLRHRASASDIQGFDDKGIDVYCQFVNRNDDYEVIGLQIKDHNEIESDLKRDSANRVLIPKLKAQYVDAKRAHKFSKFYIVLCTDAIKNADFIRRVHQAFEGIDDVTVVDPEQAWHFFRLDSDEISAWCTQILSEGDYAITKLKERFEDDSPVYRKVLIRSVVENLEGKLTFDIRDFEDYADYQQPDITTAMVDELEKVVHQLMLEDLIDNPSGGTRFEVNFSEEIAIRAIYYDLRVRHDIAGEWAAKRINLLAREFEREGI